MITSSIAASVTFGGAVAFLLILAALHVLKPQLDPSWRLISEYAIGRHGWLMTLAFVSLSVSCFALHFALGLSPGSVALAVVGLGPLGSALFVGDPTATPWKSQTSLGRLHTAFATLFVLGFPPAATIVAWNLSGDQTPASTQSLLAWISLIVWAGFLVFIGSIIFYGAPKCRFGPQVRIGWQNRLMMLIYSTWLIIVAWKG
jgi:drug/metabolite transporter (DMT)-like permease